MNTQKVTIEHLKDKKERGGKIVMLTAYDFPLGHFVDQAGTDIVLVGDSLANVVLGLERTTDVGMDEMLHHAKAVRRAVKRALLVGDMPFDSYQANTADAVANARRFVDEAGCEAVKLEWFEKCPQVAGKIIQAGIPVMGHVGLTPQTAEKLGGFKVQGKEAASAKAIMEHARQLQDAGCFSLVLECIPKQLAAVITRNLKVPTIGIGAGNACDGQVLVTHDLLGLFERFRPKFAKQYVNLGEKIKEGILAFKKDVASGAFPDDAHSFTMREEELKNLGVDPREKT